MDLMRKDALGQIPKAFEEGREQIFCAMTVIHEFMEYARKQGLIALSEDQEYACGYVGGREAPYVLDVIEARESFEIPLKRYLALGLEYVSWGEDIEKIEEFLTNKYYANAYTGKDALIAYLYFVGMRECRQGLCYEDMLQCLNSFVPDAEEDRFKALAIKWKEEIVGKKFWIMEK